MPVFEPTPTIPLMERSAEQIDRAYDAWIGTDMPLTRRIRGLEFAVALHIRDYRFRQNEDASLSDVVTDVITTAAVFEDYLANGVGQ